MIYKNGEKKRVKMNKTIPEEVFNFNFICLDCSGRSPVLLKGKTWSHPLIDSFDYLIITGNPFFDNYLDNSLNASASLFGYGWMKSLSNSSC